METTTSEPSRLRAFKIRISIFAAVLFIGLMIISNPSERSFERYLREYVKTESRSTLTSETPPVAIGYIRHNYFLFSSYEMAIDGEMHEYLGIFGTFKKY